MEKILRVKQYGESDWFEFTDSLCPSQMLPEIEYIKNAERSIDGKLHVDISASKQSLQIIFDVLEQCDFDKLKEILNIDNPNPEGIYVEFNNITKAGSLFFADEFTFLPLVVEDGIKWREVTGTLVEI